MSRLEEIYNECECNKKSEILEAMKRYAEECVKASLNKAYQESLINSDLHTFCACEIDEESITKPENIILL